MHGLEENGVQGSWSYDKKHHLSKAVTWTIQGARPRLDRNHVPLICLEPPEICMVVKNNPCVSDKIPVNWFFVQSIVSRRKDLHMGIHDFSISAQGVFPISMRPLELQPWQTTDGNTDTKHPPVAPENDDTSTEQRMMRACGIHRCQSQPLPPANICKPQSWYKWWLCLTC